MFRSFLFAAAAATAIFSRPTLAHRRVLSVLQRLRCAAVIAVVAGGGYVTVAVNVREERRKGIQRRFSHLLKGVPFVLYCLLHHLTHWIKASPLIWTAYMGQRSERGRSIPSSSLGTMCRKREE